MFDIGITKSPAKPKRVQKLSHPDSRRRQTSRRTTGTKLVHDATKGRLFDSVGITPKTRDAAGGLELLPGVPEAEADDELGSFTTSSREGAMFKSADVTTKFWRKSVRVEAFSEVCRESLVFVGNVGIRLGDS